MNEKPYTFQHAHGGPHTAAVGPWIVEGPGLEKGMRFEDRTQCALVVRMLNSAYAAGADDSNAKLTAVDNALTRADVPRFDEGQPRDRLNRIQWAGNTIHALGQERDTLKQALGTLAMSVWEHFSSSHAPAAQEAPLACSSCEDAVKAARRALECAKSLPKEAFNPNANFFLLTLIATLVHFECPKCGKIIGATEPNDCIKCDLVRANFKRASEHIDRERVLRESELGEHEQELHDLTPCPFCGDTVGYMVHIGDVGHFFVRCRMCAAEGPWRKTEEGALAAWSRRL